MASCVLPGVEAVGAGVEARRRYTVWVVLAAVLARGAVVWYAVRHFPVEWFYGRGVEMGLLAQSLVRGAGLSSPFGGETGPTAMIAPGYPAVVAGVFRVFGVMTPASAVVMMGLQAGLGGLTVWMMVRLGRRVASEGAAVGMSLLWACSPVTVWMPTIFWETNFSVVLLLGFVMVALELERGGVGRWGSAGVWVGVAGLVNPALLPAMGGMAGWAGWRGRRGRGMLLAAAGFLLVFSAWPVRNWRVFGAFIPTRTTVGFELWMGNRVGGTGFLDESLFPMFNRVELADYVARGEVGYMGHKAGMAKAYVRSHPWATVRLTGVRVVRFWTGTGNSRGSGLFLVYALATTGLGLWGLWRLQGTGVAGMVAIALVLFPVPYYLTHAEFRYRLVVDPLLCVMAAGTVDGWRRRVRG